MNEVFSLLKNIIKVRKVAIDNSVFRLHYKFTTLMLIAFSILVNLCEYFGDPIDCIQNDDIPKDTLDLYCWIHGNFSLVDEEVRVEVLHPGIDEYITGETRMYYPYYRWVCLVLFLQAIFFYVPKYVWKCLGQKKIQTLLVRLNSQIGDIEDQHENTVLLANYVKTTMKTHKSYVSSYMFCELLNFVNVVSQIYLIDTFLEGEFSDYGIEVIRFVWIDQVNRADPMIKVFPRMTECPFYGFGSSGDIRRRNTLCIIPLNIVNERIYAFLWFWFIILALLSAVVLLCRFFIIFWPATRYLSLSPMPSIASKKDLKVVLSHSELGEWFVLYLLRKNMDPTIFYDVVNMLANELREDKKLLDNQVAPFEKYKSL